MDWSDFGVCRSKSKVVQVNLYTCMYSLVFEISQEPLEV